MDDEEAVESPEAGTGLVALALATCNLSLAFLTIVLIAYRRDLELGERLSNLGIGIGLGLFALLWSSAIWATGGALRGLGALMGVRFVNVVGRGIVWGGRAGVLVFLALVLFVAVLAVARDIDHISVAEAVTNGPLLLLYLGAVVSIGGALAFLAGATVGIAAAVADFGILALARLAIRHAGLAITYRYS